VRVGPTTPTRVRETGRRDLSSPAWRSATLTECRLQVERAANKGYRTMRTTTNKAGRWCKPHKSTYSNSLIVVARDWDTEHQHAWLSCGNPRAVYGDAHVCVQYANGAGIALAKCGRNDAPRRD
jgi:hypothetical protein